MGLLALALRARFSRWSRAALLCLAATFISWSAGAAPAGAGVTYSIDDGTSELGLGIDPGEDSLSFNRFLVQPGGEVITSISAAFGRPGGASTLNGLAIRVLLYEDVDGGAPWNAVLLRSVDAVVANGNTNTLNVYEIEPTEVHGTLLAAVLFRNRTGVNKFIAAVDRTVPHVSDASFYAYTIGDMNESDLTTVPAGQFGTLEGLGFPGNYLLRANGVPIPEPGLASPLALAALALALGRAPSRARAAI